MAPAPSKNYTDDVSLLVVTLDTNPFFWSDFPSHFSDFLSQVLAFLNSILLLGQLNQVVVIATGCNSCSYIYDSSSNKNHASTNGTMPALYSNLLHNLDEFIAKDEQLTTAHEPGNVPSSLLSGSLSKALCYIQRAFRSGPMHPQPRILCLQGSPDGPEQYVAIMNAIFSAQRSSVPVDSCYIGSSNSAFLQQASYITGGIYYKPPQLDGLFQYLSAVFATDLHSRAFLRLPKSLGVDFRASCFCHKKTIDTGYVCSVCLSIFCEHHDKCSTSLFLARLNLLPLQQTIGKGRLNNVSGLVSLIL
ncbi:general transcription and DNA repair factor IIH subunit TFB4-like isoform X1 [Vicia villosa]|uniref:general transcription and DNA repair factor IIH subunit TFB4-like isoform X1 n=1 Tax=Vicia villosa TaxID=3911 RepID=UPI00273C06B2|nr:general transcription and DNA repair factor IIH subunit TFB4-like isoform X1 [Vicia villosa]